MIALTVQSNAEDTWSKYNSAGDGLFTVSDSLSWTFNMEISRTKAKNFNPESLSTGKE